MRNVGYESTLGCVEESVMKGCEGLFVLRGDAFLGGKEDEWVKIRRCAWFAFAP